MLSLSTVTGASATVDSIESETSVVVLSFMKNVMHGILFLSIV